MRSILAFWVGRCSLSLTALKQREKSVFRSEEEKQDCAAGLAFWVDPATFIKSLIKDKIFNEGKDRYCEVGTKSWS